MRLLCLLPLAALISPATAADEPQVASQTAFLENGKIKLGVDLSSGGSVFWFSTLPDGPNLLNHASHPTKCKSTQPRARGHPAAS